MKKAIVILCSIIFLSNFHDLGANDFLSKYCRFVNHHILPAHFSSKTRFAQYGESIYVCKIKMEMIDGIQHVAIYSTKTSVPEYLAFSQDSNIIDVMGFTANDNYFIVSANRILAIYDRHQKNKLLLYKNLGFDSENIKIIGDDVYMYEAAISSSYTAKPSYTHIDKYSIKKDEITKAHFFEDPVGAALYDFQPRSTLDINDKYIVVSDIINYKIDIYNHDFKLLFSVNRTPPSWRNASNKEALLKDLKLTYQYCKERKTHLTFPILSPWVYDSLSLIDKVYLDDDQLFIVWTEPKGESGKIADIYIDIWKIKEKAVELIEGDISIFHFDGATKYDKDNLSLYSNLIISNNKVLAFSSNPFPLDSVAGKTLVEYDKMKKSYYLENDIRESIYLYEIKK